ncbi:MAG: hypothetical protein JSV93_01260 [Candidatus Omnitrophota bacterium]|nr:MAG: hypothetical protein JSV93_01260 [Candidatus Omnitrophota bacterium]
MRKIISTILIFCFLMSNTGLAIELDGSNPSPSMTLGAPLKTDPDILSDQERYDMARIEYALETLLRRHEKDGRVTLTYERYCAIIKNQGIPESTIYQPRDMHFFLSEAKATEHGIYVVCRIKGRDDYHVFFYLQKKDGHFPIEIYTDKQYKETDGFTKGWPQRRDEDVKSIKRDVDHEKGTDFVLRYAHEHGLAKKPYKGNFFDFREEVKKMLEKLEITVTTPDGLMPIEDREFYLVNRTGLENIFGNDGLKEMLKTTVIVDGIPHEMTCYAHSSNHAIHVFVDEDIYQGKKTFFNFPRDFGFLPSYDETSRKPTLSGLNDYKMHSEFGALLPSQFVLHGAIAYEIGNILGYAPSIYEREIDGDKIKEVSNPVYERLLQLIKANDAFYSAEQAPELKPLHATVVDLRGQINRDFAYGDLYSAIDTDEKIGWISHISSLNIGKRLNEIRQLLKNKSLNKIKDIIAGLKSDVSAIHTMIFDIKLQIESRGQSISKEAMSKWFKDKDAKFIIFDLLKDIENNRSLLSNTTSEEKINSLSQKIEELTHKFGTRINALVKTAESDVTKTLAKEVGRQIAPPAQKYTLFVTDDFITNTEYDKDVNTGRFNLVRLPLHETTAIVEHVLEEVAAGRLSPENIVIQFSKDFCNVNHKKILNKLTRQGIKFVIVNTEGIKGNEFKQEYRKNIYGIMLLTRLLDKKLKFEHEELYNKGVKILTYLVRQHITGKGDRTVLVKECVQALIAGTAGVLLQRILNAIPIEPFEKPNKETVAAVLLSA